MSESFYFFLNKSFFLSKSQDSIHRVCHCSRHVYYFSKYFLHSSWKTMWWNVDQQILGSFSCTLFLSVWHEGFKIEMQKRRQKTHCWLQIWWQSYNCREYDIYLVFYGCFDFFVFIIYKKDHIILFSRLVRESHLISHEFWIDAYNSRLKH